MAVTSGVFGKYYFTSPGILARVWYNSSTNAATVDVTICNESNSTANIRIAIIPASTDTVNKEDYILFNQPIDAGYTYVHSGIVMSTQETIYVYSDVIGVAARVHGFVNDTGPAASDIGMATYVNAGLTQYAAGFDIISEDKAATPKLVKAIVDAYGGGGGTGAFSAKAWTTLLNPIPVGHEIAVPSYIVGSNQLSVYFDGVLSKPGLDANSAAYKEVGATGVTSSSIIVFDRYETGTEICAMV